MYKESNDKRIYVYILEDSEEIIFINLLPTHLENNLRKFSNEITFILFIRRIHCAFCVGFHLKCLKMKYLHDTLNISDKSLQRILFLPETFCSLVFSKCCRQLLLWTVHATFNFAIPLSFLYSISQYSSSICVFFFCVFNIPTFTFNS